ncbi:MAG: fatty acid desaturase family protein [Methylococcales bacterium]
MINRKVVFATHTNSSFAREVKQNVSDYFRERQLSTKADASMALKSVLMTVLTFGPYGLMLSNRYEPWTMLILAILMGIGFAGMGFCIGHDAHHGAYSSNPKINELLGLSYDILGANSYLWKLTHNSIHHIYTNVTGIDEDILVVDPVVRLSPGSKRYWHHRFQHYYAWIVYSLATINWVFGKDFRYILLKQLGPYQDIQHSRFEIWKLIGFKSFHLTWSLVIPLIVIDLPVTQIIFGYLVVHLVAGWILGVVFQLAHVVEAAKFVTPDQDGRIDEDWIAHQMSTTANFATHNNLLTWYIGGLNYQIEHHLFPRICSVHYPRVRNIVEETARRHGLPYHCYPTVRAVMAAHFRTLKTHGISDEARHAVPIADAAV